VYTRKIEVKLITIRQLRGLYIVQVEDFSRDTSRIFRPLHYNKYKSVILPFRLLPHLLLKIFRIRLALNQLFRGSLHAAQQLMNPLQLPQQLTHLLLAPLTVFRRVSASGALLPPAIRWAMMVVRFNPTIIAILTADSRPSAGALLYNQPRRLCLIQRLWRQKAEHILREAEPAAAGVADTAACAAPAD
jgi:hypothetical protein